MDAEPMCRACLSESGDAVPIFSSAETSGVQMPLSDMMMACSSVQVMSGDGLPGLICLECLRSLLIAFEFKLKCEKTDAMLREYIENNLVPMQTGNIYNKQMNLESTSGTLVPVATSTNQTNELKPIISTNELISGIPTIAINSANTAIYSNANPYIIPMVECDVLVKEEQDAMDGKIYQKQADGTTNATGNIIMKKIDAQTANLTPVNTVDMSTFSQRLIPSEIIQQSPSQITIYGSEFRDLIRVSEDQQQQTATTIVMPKLEPLQTVNTMAQCNVLTTNSYTIDQHNQLIQNSVINANTSSSQNTTTNNNFITTMTIPTNVTFTIKENAVRKVKQLKTPNKTDSHDNGQQVEMIHTVNSVTSVDNSQQTQTTFHQPLKVESSTTTEDNTTTNASTDQPVNKKQKTCHHKKKTIYSTTDMNNKTVTIRSNNKVVQLHKDSKNNNDQQTTSGKTIIVHGQNDVNVVNSEITQVDAAKVKETTTVFYQGFMR